MIVQHLARSRSRYWDCKISWSTKCWDCKTPCKIDPLITSHQSHHCPQDQPCQRPTLHCLQKQSQLSARPHLVFTKFGTQETYFVDAEAFSLSRQLQCIDWSWWSSPTSVFPNSCLSSRCHRTAPPRLMCGAQTNQLAEEGNRNRKQGNWSIRHDLKGWKSWRCVRKSVLSELHLFPQVGSLVTWVLVSRVELAPIFEQMTAKKVENLQWRTLSTNKLNLLVL